MARAERRDPNETLLNAGFAAAAVAANAVTDANIKARYYPFLKFYSDRKTIKLGRMLKAKGIESFSHRGRTCYNLHSLIKKDTWRK